MRATAEVNRLEGLCWDAYHYNQELACLKWKHPWPPTDLDSTIGIRGRRCENYWRRGKECFVMSFPEYYIGPVHGARPLPPAILAVELKEARDYRDRVRTYLNATDVWAPGGSGYERLLKTTLVPVTISKH